MPDRPRGGVGLVIFDCDGVLVDSEPIALRILAGELAAAGLSLDAGDERLFVGRTFESTVEIAEARLGRPLPVGFAARVRSRTFAAFRVGLRAMPGVHEALDALEVPYCVASSGDPEKMRLTLGLTGLLPRFEGRMFSASEVARGKPWPDLFRHAARVLGVEPARTIVVEDSLPGVAAARAAGMRVLGYAPPGGGAELVAAGAVPIHDLGELARLVHG